MNTRFVLCTLGIVIASFLMTPAHAANLVAGAGTATFGSCPAGSDSVTVTGASTDGASWTFVIGDANASNNTACAIVGGGVYQGAWNPAVGGCIAAVAGTTLCLTNPVSDADSTTYAITINVLVAGGPTTGTVDLTIA